MMASTVVILFGILVNDVRGTVYPKFSHQMLWIACGLLAAVVGFELVRMAFRVKTIKHGISWFFLLTLATTIPLWMFANRLKSSHRKQQAYDQLNEMMTQATADKKIQLSGHRRSAFTLRENSDVTELTEACFGIEEDIGCGCCYDYIDSGINDANVEPLLCFSQLEKVDFQRSAITDKAIRYLARSQSLKDLNLAGCKNLTEAVVSELTRFSELETLNLAGLPITSASARHLFELQELRSLDLSQTKVDDNVLSTLAQLPKLTWLCVYNSSVTGAGISQLSRCSKLTYVYLPSVSVSTANELNSLRSLTEIGCNVSLPSSSRRIQFDKTKSAEHINLTVHSPIDATTIRDLPKLQSLYVNFKPTSRTPDRSTTYRISNLPKLTSLGIPGADSFEVTRVPNVEQITLFNKVTPAVIEKLSGFAKLKKLTVYTENVSASHCLMQVPSLAKLESVTLQLNQVKPDFFNQFLASLPDLPYLNELTVLLHDTQNQGFPVRVLKELKRYPKLRRIQLPVVDEDASRQVIEGLNLNLQHAFLH